MIIDANSLRQDEVIETDVCIVGAGVAGITLATELTGQSFRVCILESGDVKANKETQALCDGANIGLPYYPLDTARARQFGGSTNRWLLEIGEDNIGARLRPLDEIDFEEREWVPNSGWPYSKAHLEPYYQRAQEKCKSGPYKYLGKDWETNRAKEFVFKLNKVRTAIFQFVDRKVFTKDYKATINEAGNVTNYVNANVLEVVTDKDEQQVEHLRVACLDKKEFKVKAKKYILALGGIETPRLMLLSNRVNPKGVGNQHDVVGRYFMEHPHLWSGLFVPSDTKLFKNALMYDTHRVNGHPVLGQLAIDENVLREQKMLNYGVHIVPGIRPRNAAGKQAGVKESVTGGISTLRLLVLAVRNRDLNDFNRRLSTLFPVVNDFSIAMYRKAAKIFKKITKTKNYEVFKLNHMTEQVPNPKSRVTLSDEVDHFGQRKAALDWQLTELDVRSIRQAQAIMDEEFQASGLGRVEIELEDDTPPPDIHGGWHHMGTTRMHIDPTKGVVDENAKVHGLANLYIAGPSVFPTSGFANPVMTIMATTIRLADKLKTEMNQ